MRLFGSDRLTKVVETLGLEENDAIEHKMLSNAIENAQKRVEGKNFDIRKHVIQYDDVMNKQREVIYGERRRVLNGENLRDNYMKMLEGVTDAFVKTYCGEDQYADTWDWAALKLATEGVYVPKGSLDLTKEEIESFNKDDLKEKLIALMQDRYKNQEEEIGEDVMRELERVILLRVVDQKWMDHIDAMDQLRYGIGLRAYGQRDPVIEYKFEGFAMFEEMTASIQEDSTKFILNTHIQKDQALQREKVAEPTSESYGDIEEKKPVKNSKKVGRNDSCPCGSGKKYKNCCGK